TDHSTWSPSNMTAPSTSHCGRSTPPAPTSSPAGPPYTARTPAHPAAASPPIDGIESALNTDSSHPPASDRKNSFHPASTAHRALAPQSRPSSTLHSPHPPRTPHP